MSLRMTLLGAAVAMALPLGAQAQTVTGLYVAGAAGVNWLGNTSDRLVLPESGFKRGFLNANGPAAANGAAVPPFTDYGSVDARFNTGWAVVGSLGWGFGNGLRAEGELSYRSNSISGLRVNGNPTFVPEAGFSFPACESFGDPTACVPTRGGSGGSVTNTALMANVFYDFNFRWVMPYVGLGIGATSVNWNNVRGSAGTINSFGETSTYNYRINGTSLQFAYQFMGGLAFPIAAVPGLAITAEYRYFASLSPNVNATVWNNFQCCQGFQNNTSQGGGKLTFDNTNQTVLLGVRYNFGQQRAAAAPVAAAPAPARSFLVFFDFGSDQLTARAREIVGQAAQASRTQQVTRIEVAGHTDTVGSAQYNQGLSIRRANNVAAELVRLGVPRQNITTAGFGFSRPLVPTGPNVREPQNRRVEIVLR